MVQYPHLSGRLLIGRRQLLVLGASWATALLAGCRGGDGPGLWAVRGELPPAWARLLPAAWKLRQLDDAAHLLAELKAAPRRGPQLIAITDGWATSVPRDFWQPGERSGAQPSVQHGMPSRVQALLGQLAPFALPASRLFGDPDQSALAFPWAYTPWVIALRNRPDLASQAERGWQLLLDSSLRGRLVLPSSARVCIELMDGDFARVQQLRRQALAYSDRDGLNLLLSGVAQAAVLPLRPLVPLLRRDPRLQLIWPSSGAPLSWQLLLRPSQADLDVAWPISWLEAMLQPPLLANLLAAGWVPPLSFGQLWEVVESFPAPLRPLLAADPALLARCRSLPPLDGRGRLALQSLWDAAAP